MFPAEQNSFVLMKYLSPNSIETNTKGDQLREFIYYLFIKLLNSHLVSRPMYFAIYTILVVNAAEDTCTYSHVPHIK